MRSRFRRHLLVWLVFTSGLAGAPAAARADTITLNLGFVSFDSYVGSSGSSTGTAVFTVWNLAGGDLPSFSGPTADFLVCTPVRLLALRGVGTYSDGPVQLFTAEFGGEAPPGSTSTGQFPEVPALSRATFTAVLSTTLLEYWIADGVTAWVQLPSAEIGASMWPPQGSTALADGGFAMLTVTGTVVPEPATLLLLGSGLATVLGARRIRVRRRPS